MARFQQLVKDLRKAYRRLTRPRRLFVSTDLIRKTYAGPFMDQDLALRLSAVWSCVRIISETLAAMPWHVVERIGETRQRVEDSEVDVLLNVRPNREMSGFDFKQAVVAQVLLWGNAYAEIERNGNQVINLWPIPAASVTPERLSDGRIVYRVWEETGPMVDLPGDKTIHVRGLSPDGIRGFSVIAMAANSLGLSAACERFGSEFFGNGAHFNGVLVHPNELGDEGHKQLEEMITSKGGWGNWHSPLILEEGMEWKPISMPNEDAQFLETRRFQIEEIARWFRVPPHKLAQLDRATFSNIEHQSIEFVTDTIMPWAARIESEINVKLLGNGANSRRQVLKINLDALLRGDLKSRYEAYAIGRQMKFLSANDVLAREDMNPIEGGDVYENPSISVDKPTVPAPRSQRPNIRACKRLLTSTMRRLLARECRAIENIGKNRKPSVDWLTEFYGTEHRASLNEWYTVVLGILEAIAGRSLEIPCNRHHNGDDTAYVVRELLEAWIREGAAERMRFLVDEGHKPPDGRDEEYTALRVETLLARLDCLKLEAGGYAE